MQSDAPEIGIAAFRVCPLSVAYAHAKEHDAEPQTGIGPKEIIFWRSQQCLKIHMLTTLLLVHYPLSYFHGQPEISVNQISHCRWCIRHIGFLFQPRIVILKNSFHNV